jgi:hypothetical protein
VEGAVGPRKKEEVWQSHIDDAGRRPRGAIRGERDGRTPDLRPLLRYFEYLGIRRAGEAGAVQ